MDIYPFERFKMRYFIVLYFVLSVAMLFVLGSFLQPSYEDLFAQMQGIEPAQSTDINALAQGSVLVVSVILLAYIWLQIRMHHISFQQTTSGHVMTKKRWGKYIALTIGVKIYAALLIFIIGGVALFQLMGSVEDWLEFVGVFAVGENVQLSPIAYVMLVISTVILAPIWEELFFRGIMLRKFMIKWRTSTSIFVSSLLFAIFHFQLATIIYAFLIGVVLSIVYLKTKNIVVPIIMHAVANLLSILLLWPSDKELLERQWLNYLLHLSRTELSIILVISIVLFIVVTIALWLVIRRRSGPLVRALQQLEIVGVEEQRKDYEYQQAEEWVHYDKPPS